MAFQILDNQGVAIPINKLDEEAAIFWGKELNKKSYATPFKLQEGINSIDEMCSNWFDIIGRSISSQGDFFSGWSNIVHTMIADLIGTKFIDFSVGYDKRNVTVYYPEDVLNEDGGVIDVLFPDNIKRGIYATLSFHKPFIELINHWQSKGYTPEKVD